jgi:geranylgeranyl pyrophosphate synthase
LKSTLEIFTLVKDDLKQVEQTMIDEPTLLAAQSFAPADGVRSDTPPEVLTSIIRHLVSSGGKRVRPALALVVNHIYPTDIEKSVSLAAAIEMLHTATLVHDDLIDGSLLRRGNPTLNATWTPGATVLSGDFLFARAADLAAQTDNVRVMRLFAQTFDKYASLSRQHYYDRIYAKTAALFAVASEAAAVLGNAPQPAVAALRDYGENLGMGFQIVDDVLDFVSDETQLGKPAGSDLRAGLVTAPTLWFLQQNTDHALLRDILGNGRRDDGTIMTAVRDIRESGAIEASLNDARQFIEHSRTALEILPQGNVRDALRELSDFVVERSW